MTRPSDTLPTLRQVLAGAQLRVAALAVLISVSALMLAGLATIGIYARTNLDLIARTASYSVAPAIVFDDPKGIDASLRPLVATAGIKEIVVRGSNGELLARLDNPAASEGAGLSRLIERTLLAEPAQAPIIHLGGKIGDAYVVGDGRIVTDYVVVSIVGAVACLLLALLASFLLARRLQAKIVSSLRSIVDVAHAVRAERDFDQRVGPASIREIDDLRIDFNGLIGELAAWQDHLRNENRELSHKATHDPLTGLPNRASFEETLSRTIAVAERHEQPFVVMLADGNGFKSINDRFGHVAGDAVLVEIAGRLRLAMRQTDMAARIGGDEFALLLAPPTQPETVDRVIAAIEQAMLQPVRLPSGTLVNFSLTFGSASYPEDGDSIFTLVHHADLQMYARKATSRPPTPNQPSQGAQ